MPESAAPRILIAGLPGVPVADWLREAGYTVLCAGSGAALLRLAGGSPADRPISRCAMAKRVTLSIRQSTSCSRSRKYSATESVK